MAWVEGKTWELEQGRDNPLSFRLWADTAKTTPWVFTGYDVNATISDITGRHVYPVTVEADAALGTVRLIALEATVALLRPGRAYRYDCLMVAPGGLLADDPFLAAGPASVFIRSTRRDP
jgi:hypothetical protein